MAEKEWGGFGKALASIVGERLASPLTGTFALSWSLWNFKFFVILFSKNSVTDTYALIQTECFPNPFMSFFNGLVAPLTLTMAYFYLLPVLSKIIFEEWSRTQKETKDIKQRWEDQNLLGYAEGQELRQNLRLAQGKLEDFDTEVRKLKAELRQADNRSVETQEVLRVTDADRLKSQEELARVQADVDAARNAAGSFREALAETKKQADAANTRADLLQKKLAEDDRPKRLAKETEAALLVVFGGRSDPIKYLTSLPGGDKSKHIQQIAELADRNFISNTRDDQERIRSEVTATGINYLVRYGLIGISQLDALLNYGPKLDVATLADKNLNALANTNWAKTISPEVVNKLAASMPDRTTIAAAINALAGTNKLSKEEINVLIGKLTKT